MQNEIPVPATLRGIDESAAYSDQPPLTTRDSKNMRFRSVYFEPGQQNDPLATTTDLLAYGNVGLDEDLYGDTMCTTWTTADSCDIGGVNPATKIPVNNQKYATSSVAYAAGNSLTSSTSPSLLLINVPKTTSTSSPETKNTWWGINIPSAITLAGNYSGQNTITAIKSDPTNW